MLLKHVKCICVLTFRFIKPSYRTHFSYVKKMGDAKVRVLCDEFWEWRMRSSPEFASYCGDQRFSHLLDEIDTEAFLGFQSDVSKLMKKAEEIPLKELSKVARNDLILVKDQLQTFLNGMKHKGWYFPINFMEGMHADVPKVIKMSLTNTEEDLRNLNKRIESYGKKAKSCLQILKEGVTNGYVCHRLSVEWVPEQIKEMISTDLSPEKDPFLSPYSHLTSEKIETNSCDKLLQEAKDIVRTIVRPAFKELAEYIQNEYLNRTRPSIAHTSLPDGRALYQACLDFHLSFPMTPQEVFDLGQSEVERITQAMRKISNEEGFGDDVAKFMESLKKRKEFFFDTPEDLLKYVNDMCFEKIQPKLPTLFREFPESKLRIEPTPPLMTSGPFAFYFSGSPDGTRPGVYFIRTSNLKGSPSYELTALSLHEGEPGHHFQTMISMEMKDIHSFRRAFEDLNYGWVPSRFPLYTAYLEGWGLYCEYLGEEMGMYEDNYTLFGRYSMEILRAARLVVDPGMHALGWSYEKALNYLKEKTFMDGKSLDIECRRYVTLPGQACAYKVGEIKLRQLRQKAKDALGDQFDVKDFHSVVLKCGAVPLKFLEKEIDEYIKEKEK
uniref:Uncharacterized protein LOC111103156 n=1 Tax=Crassostrea virginica TaxID=6565 RepID=A0A8B8AK45_CRAVI|nr:uncharacterized protein LOC111103156 [Crassostrea virginica]